MDEHSEASWYTFMNHDGNQEELLQGLKHEICEIVTYSELSSMNTLQILNKFKLV